MYLNDIYTVNANITGNCAMSVPVGHTKVNGALLPIGLQLQAQAFNETTLFRAGAALESMGDLL
jgi:aspartyl-tRNA(Asn)/glutamyl-tRNA(Gln) amidotransferase subunit A